jgi:hypothetical protein
MPFLVQRLHHLVTFTLTCTVLHYQTHNPNAHPELSAKPVERERFDVTKARHVPTAKASAQVHSIVVKVRGRM